ncbi:hypothetical protein MHBO_001835 [Bonamia ostreae]|uniref:Uncharacterized protein n=1 Tax=Bonamia ostreae TaxID=126728 RepID=A0ABV2AKC1_9EUKA
MEQIKNKIDNEIAKNEKIELKRRKRIKEMIDVEENDIFIDRTNKKIKSVEKEETEILIEETNLKLKLEKLEEKLNSNKVVENDSLDSFMADINNESLKRQIAAIHKRLKQIRNSLK